MIFIYRILGLLAGVVGAIATLLAASAVIICIFIRWLKGMDASVYLWARFINWLGRVEVVSSGQEHVPAEPCMFVFNHMSLLDIPVVLVSVRKRMLFGAKKELFYIPIFGWAISMAGFLKIHRGNRQSAVETLKKAKKRMEARGESFILAAEGTRQMKNEIGLFKSGPFITAIQAQVPIVPIVIKGVHTVLPQKSVIFRLEKKHICTVQVLEPISTKGLVTEDRHRLKEDTREKMLKAFQKSV